MTVNSTLGLILSCIGMLAARAPRSFLLTVIAAIVLAAVWWWICINYSKLWNKRFHITAFHHVLCALASVATLLFTLTYVSLRYTRDIAAQAVDQWHKQLLKDQRFTDQTFLTAYQSVKGLNVENFANFPPPPAGKKIPLSQQVSRTTFAKTYADGACLRDRTHP